MRKVTVLLLGIWLGIGALLPTWSQASGLAEAPQAGSTGTGVLYLPYISGSNASQRCTPEELIRDGGFEAGTPSAVWQVQSNVYSDILDDTPVPPAHGGDWKAWMGGDNRVQESLWQAFTVPSDGAGIRVSYWWRVDTFETSHPFDTLQVQIRNAAGNPLRTLEVLTDGDLSTEWQQSTFSVSGYAGEKLQLSFQAQTDDTNPTSFFIDDVSVQKLCK